MRRARLPPRPLPPPRDPAAWLILVGRNAALDQVRVPLAPPAEEPAPDSGTPNPNMLLTMGPNSGPGHTSVLIYQEAQYKYIAKYTKTLLKQKLRYLDVKEDVMQAQFDGFQERMRNSSWLSGCQSWYLNADGTNSTMWPGDRKSVV